MHIATSKKTKTAPSDKPNKSGTHQKKHALIPFENIGILKKWHMTNTPTKIDKYDTHRKCCVTKLAHLAKEYPKAICQGLSSVAFESEFLNF